MEKGSGLIRRQDVTPAYSRNGIIYMTRKKVIMEDNTIYGENCHPLIIDHCHAVNIDNRDDWEKAERLILKHNES
jgi:CMP-N-acetylneuraminic acid synthetase